MRKSDYRGRVETEPEFEAMKGRIVLLAFGLSGCFLGYDSRWGETKRAQQNFARAEAPKALQGDAHGKALTARRVLKLRVYATPTHASQVMDWPRRFEATLADVNRVLEPELSLRLVVSDARPWNTVTSEEKLETVLKELRTFDAGDDVDWVVALVGSVPRFERSYHELGYADVVGKYIALRAITNAQEYEAIERGLDEISQDERDRLRRARLSHKLAAVVLHEVGHTLGALHEKDADSLMYPEYSPERQALTVHAREVMRFTLERRTAQGALDAEAWKALAERWRREPSPWTVAERDAALAGVPSAPTSPPATTPAPTAVSVSALKASKPAPAAQPRISLPELSEKEREAFEAASARKAAGDLDGARELVLPLSARYPHVEPVQDLRCQIAMQRGGSISAWKAECEPLLKLAPNRSGKR
jgi:hypothetical protein